MKHLILFFLFAAFTVSAKAQVVWEANRPLTWADFAGPVDPSSPFSAETKCRIAYNYTSRISGNSYKLTFQVKSQFIPEESWSKRERQSPELLRHEQLHFDINELYARKLLNALQDQNYTANYKEEVKQTFSRVIKEAKDLQDRYDLETNHVLLKDKQQLWEKYIHDQLQ